MWTRLIVLWSRLRVALRRHPGDDDLRLEIAGHVELLTDRYIRSGMTPEEARRAASRQFGSALSAREQAQDVNSIRWVEEFLNDARIALRQLRSAPGFTALAAITLALGIGANSAIFALVDATLIRPLPFPQSDRLAMVWERTPRLPRGPVAPLDFRDWEERNRTFEAMAAVYTYARRLTGPDGGVTQIPGQQVTPRFFDVLGARIVIGRAFRESDVAVPPNVAVLSEGLWKARFGGDPRIVGRIVELDTQPFTVVGVVGGEFQDIAPAAVWTVWADIPGMDSRANRFMRVIGRLKPGASLAAAQDDLSRVAAELAREYPATNKETAVTVDALRDALIGSDTRSTALLFVGVVGIVLLMCCGNIARLLMARTSARIRELAVRAALGAGRARILRQLLTESLVLAAIGGALGLAVGAAILRIAPSVIPDGLLPSSIVLQFDGRVVWFCVLTTVAVGILFGGAPAWQATGGSLVDALGSDGRGTTRRGSRLRNLLVIGEVATAVLLLCAAGLLLRTLVALGSVDAGYQSENALVMVPSIDYALPTSTFGSEDALRQFLDRTEREVSAVPGVEHAGWGTSLPLAGFNALPFEIVGDPDDSSGTPLLADRQIIGPGYLPALGVPIVAGRGFSERDTAHTIPVCIVSESLAKRYLSGRSPIGVRLAVRQLNVGPRQVVVREIVGVARDVRRTLGGSNEARAIYVPIAQNPWSFVLMLVKPSARAGALFPALREAVARVDRRVPIAEAEPLDQVLHGFTARPRFRAVMVTTFAALALTLATVGVFGLLAYVVQQRRREFGVRLALGASTGAVLRLVLAGAGRLIGLGAFAGLVLTVLSVRWISTFLFGVRPLDPLTFAAALVLLAVAATVAALVPALRASHVDPIVAFRAE